MYPPARAVVSVPLVSGVMPKRNAEPYLDKAIQSILAQALKTLEPIIVINGSTHSSEVITSAYTNRDERVTVTNLPCRNILQALNAGIEAAQDPWVARMDADDNVLQERPGWEYSLFPAGCGWQLISGSPA